MLFASVVISGSKIRFSKAIHNEKRRRALLWQVVISGSKIRFSKAIHNYLPKGIADLPVVISGSKIRFSKAIHNRHAALMLFASLLSVVQR